MGVLEGWAFSYGRGAPVILEPQTQEWQRKPGLKLARSEPGTRDSNLELEPETRNPEPGT